MHVKERPYLQRIFAGWRICPHDRPCPKQRSSEKKCGTIYRRANFAGRQAVAKNFIVREAIRTSLKLATSTQTIEVSNDAGSVINTEHGTIGDTKDFAQLAGLEVNYRGPTIVRSLLSTVPGALQDAKPMVMRGAVLSLRFPTVGPGRPVFMMC